MTQQDGIRRRADGSIDTDYYLEIGRECRSSAFQNMFRAMRRGGKETGSSGDREPGSAPARVDELDTIQAMWLRSVSGLDRHSTNKYRAIMEF